MRPSLAILVPAVAVAVARPASANEAPPDLSFDLLDPPKVRAPSAARAAALGRAATLRRGLLTAHQVLGFATLAGLAATMVLGQLNYNDKYWTGDHTRRWEAPHLALSIGSTVLFGATGLLALVAPNPYPKPLRLDTSLVHKIALAAATVGMVAEIVLGPVTSARVGHADQAPLATAHLVTGWATFALMAAGVVAFVF